MTDGPLTFGSLFTGIGGLDLGLESAGFRVAFQVENDDFCNRVLDRRWPGVPRFRDVRDVRGADLPRVDLLAGGDPCQENSQARRSDSCEHPSLGGEFVRIVGELRPRLVLRENPARVRRDAPWPWRRFADELRALGYHVLPFRLRACCLGLDHRRDRLFVLAALPDPDGVAIQPGFEPGPDPRAEGEVQGEARPRGFRLESRPALLAPRRPVNVRPPRIADGLPARVGERMLRGYGNAVPPVMGEWIGRRIIKHFGAPWKPDEEPRS